MREAEDKKRRSGSSWSGESLNQKRLCCASLFSRALRLDFYPMKLTCIPVGRIGTWNIKGTLWCIGQRNMQLDNKDEDKSELLLV